MSKRAADIDAEIDALFQLSLAEFTGARNALAARLKKEGRTDDADRVKGIPKPPAPAWAVNQLYWQNPKDIEQLLAVSERVRKAQATQLAGKQSDLRNLFDERRKLLSALKTRASEILDGAGHAATPDAMRRIAATLESLAAWGRTDGAPRAGRLTGDLDAPGFDALAALVPHPGGRRDSGPAKVLQFRMQPTRAVKEKKSAEDQAAARARAREAVKAADKALREARREAERAEAAMKKATARTDAAEKQKQELEKRYEQAREEAHAAARDAHRAAQLAERAAHAVKDAERALERAEAAFEQYE